MVLNIGTNFPSLMAQSNFIRPNSGVQASFARLSSGLRINSAADDPAGLALSDSMAAQIGSYSVAERNAGDGVSMTNVADGAAGQIGDMLQRMRDLAVQSTNGTLGTADRANINTEFTALRSEIDRVANTTTFNGQNLLSGPGATVNMQVGTGATPNDQVGVQVGGTTTGTLGVSGSAVDTVANAQSAITSIDGALGTLSTTRAGFGAAVEQLQGAAANDQSMEVNLTAAKSRIADVDAAQETGNHARQQVLSQGSLAMLAQANQNPQIALSLLRTG